MGSIIQATHWYPHSQVCVILIKSGVSDIDAINAEILLVAILLLYLHRPDLSNSVFYLHGLLFSKATHHISEGCGATWTPPFLQQRKALGGSCLLPFLLQLLILLSEMWLGGDTCGSQGRGHGEQPTLRHSGVVWGSGKHLKGLKITGRNIVPFHERRWSRGTWEMSLKSYWKTEKCLGQNKGTLLIVDGHR